MNFSLRAHNLFDTPRFARGVHSRATSAYDTSVGAAVRAAMPMVVKRANAKPTGVKATSGKPTSAKRASAKRMGVRAAATVAVAA